MGGGWEWQEEEEQQKGCGRQEVVEAKHAGWFLVLCDTKSPT